MSQESRENAQEAQYHLDHASRHLKKAGEYAGGVKDPGLRQKIKEASDKTDAAHKHVKEGLEQK